MLSYCTCEPSPAELERKTKLRLRIFEAEQELLQLNKNYDAHCQNIRRHAEEEKFPKKPVHEECERQESHVTKLQLEQNTALPIHLHKSRVTSTVKYGFSSHTTSTSQPVFDGQHRKTYYDVSSFPQLTQSSSSRPPQVPKLLLPLTEHQSHQPLDEQPDQSDGLVVQKHSQIKLSEYFYTLDETGLGFDFENDFENDGHGYICICKDLTIISYGYISITMRTCGDWDADIVVEENKNYLYNISWNNIQDGQTSVKEGAVTLRYTDAGAFISFDPFPGHTVLIRLQTREELSGKLMYVRLLKKQISSEASSDVSHVSQRTAYIKLDPFKW